MSHMTRRSLSRSKGQRSRSSGRFIYRGVYASGSCSGDRGNVFTVGTYCYALRSGAVGSAARGTSASTEGGEWRGHIVAASTQLVINMSSPNGHIREQINDLLRSRRRDGQISSERTDAFH